MDFETILKEHNAVLKKGKKNLVWDDIGKEWVVYEDGKTYTPLAKTKHLQYAIKTFIGG